MRFRNIYWLVPALSLVLAVVALADEEHPHGDVSPAARNGKVVAHIYEDPTNTLHEEINRVFAVEIGEDPLDPFFSADPGFNFRPQTQHDLVGTGSTAITSGALSFNLRVVADNSGEHTLLYWDGAGPVVFGDVPGAAPGETLRLNRGGSNATAGRATGALAGFAPLPNLASLNHGHLNSFLQDVTGSHDPILGTAPQGIYLIEMQLLVTGLEPSDPIWFVYNAGLDEDLHARALTWVETNLVPEPATLVLFAGGAGLLLVRRRIRRAIPQ